MGTNYAKPDDPDHAFVDHLMGYQPADSEDVIRRCEEIREMFTITGHAVVDRVPRTADRTVALRAIRDACQASIAALVTNQEKSE